MKNRISIMIVSFVMFQHVSAQQFVDKAVVEYEVKTNIKKTMGSGTWDEMMKDAMPTFKTGYFSYSFVGNRSLYKFDHWDPNMKLPDWYTKSDEENVWYMDFNSNTFNIQKNLYGSNFNLEDSIAAIQWRLSDETRVIAGYNCRKATGKIMDSVYVFAFYTDEITITGGPCSVSGLPGLILGLTIPRMYTSWIATSVNPGKVDETGIIPVKAKKYYTRSSFKALLNERTKDWFADDDPDSKKWREQFYWRTQL